MPYALDYWEFGYGADDVKPYWQLITSEHRDKPNFVAVVGALVAPLSDVQATLRGFVEDFDLDAAVGVQLDAVGLWIGLSRILSIPLVGVYFSWDADALVGWESGAWQGENDPDSGLVSLPDDEYRQLLRAKIVANLWDGTIANAEVAWRAVFAGQQTVILQDNQDMSMTVGLVGAPPTAIQQALLAGGYFPLKPEGVRIAFYAVPVNTGPLFAFDTDQGDLAGWDVGSWPLELESNS